MRIALVTDIHEDIVYLKEALRKIDKNNVDEIVCLGDISGFSAPHYNYLSTRNAHACLSLIRENCSIVLIGNHDLHAAQIIPDKCPFFDFPDNWYQLDYHERHHLGNNVLWLHEEYDLNPLFKQDDIEYLKTLSDIAIIKTTEFNILVSHYAFPNTSGLKKEFYTYADEFNQHFEYMQSHNCKVSFTGHSHTKGFFMTTRKNFKQYRYIKKKLPGTQVCIGIPPVTRIGKNSGFCIFDTVNIEIETIRI